jgi:hypothetical protein
VSYELLLNLFFGHSVARKLFHVYSPLRDSQIRKTQKHRRDACATAWRAGRPGTQARRPCYCLEGGTPGNTGETPVLLPGGRDAREHRRDACATARRAGRPVTQARRLCYCLEGGTPGNTGEMPVLLPGGRDARATAKSGGTPAVLRIHENFRGISFEIHLNPIMEAIR